ncbi:MAG: two-component system response regulator, partial [Calditrichaeota bacterium]
PPLRKRKTDISVLADHFIRIYNRENEKKIKGISREAMDRLMKYDFPGNVRELENIIERAVILSRSDIIETRDLPLHTQEFSEKAVLDPYNFHNGYEEKVRAFEREMILAALNQTDGNQSAAARLLAMTERHLRSRMEKLGMK